MKLVCRTEEYGDRIMIQPDFYGDGFFFTGRQPEVNQLILVELPGLPTIPESEPIGKAIKEWLNRRHESKQEHTLPATPEQLGRQRRLNELPEGVWRDATLHDLLEAQNYQSAMWRLEDSFTLQEFSDFADRWLPEAQQKMHDTLVISSEKERAAALKQMHIFFERLFSVLDLLPRHILKEHDDLISRLEKTQVTALRGDKSTLQTTPPSNFDTNKWLDLASSLQTGELIQLLLMDVARNLAKRGLSQAEMAQVLEKIKTNSKLKEHITYYAHFWQPLSHSLRLDSTVQGETIDISDAQEVTVELGWPVYEARRVGRIVPIQ